MTKNDNLIKLFSSNITQREAVKRLQKLGFGEIAALLTMLDDLQYHKAVDKLPRVTAMHAKRMELIKDELNKHLKPVATEHGVIEAFVSMHSLLIDWRTVLIDGGVLDGPSELQEVADSLDSTLIYNAIVKELRVQRKEA